MVKSERIAAFVAGLTGEGGWDARYAAYFHCFNAGDYYEAHDVLEDLWLEDASSDAAFYKALIQLAGGFVHLRKHFEHPTHPTHGRRLQPAARLLRLALTNLAPYPARHLGLDLPQVHALANSLIHALEDSDFTANPWSPDHKPKLSLAPANVPPHTPREKT
jgi:hypothetical protein